MLLYSGSLIDERISFGSLCHHSLFSTSKSLGFMTETLHLHIPYLLMALLVQQLYCLESCVLFPLCGSLDLISSNPHL
jgi:hypothetical protein